MNSSEFRYSAVVGEETGKILADALDPRLVEYTTDKEDGFEKSHLTGHTVIAQLNRIFGYGGHSWEVTSGPELMGSGGIDRQTGEIISPIGYTCTGRLTVSTQSGPVSFDGVGVEKLDSYTFNDHDKALKGAETDAMKRAARHLGTQFGLSLYFGGAFDTPAHFKAEGGEAPAKAEPTTPRQAGGNGEQTQSRQPAGQRRGNGGQKPRQNGGAAPSRGGDKSQNRRPAQAQRRGNGGAAPSGEDSLEPLPKLEQMSGEALANLLVDYAKRQSPNATEETVRQQVLEHTGKPLAELKDAELRKMVASSYRKLTGS